MGLSRNNLRKALNMVTQFDHEAFDTRMFKELPLHNHIEENLPVAIRNTHKAINFILVGLAKYARDVGIHDGSKNSQWMKLSKNAFNSDIKTTHTITDFLNKIIPLYLEHIRTSENKLGQYYLDNIFNDLFVYAQHFESRYNTSDTALELQANHEAFFKAITENQNIGEERVNIETARDLLKVLNSCEINETFQNFLRDDGYDTRGAQNEDDRFYIFEKAKNLIAFLRAQENTPDINDSKDQTKNTEELSPLNVMNALQHYLKYNGEKIPQAVNETLTNFLHMLKNHLASHAIDQQYAELSSDDLEIARSPHHASKFIVYRGHGAFLESDLVLDSDLTKNLSPDSYVQNIISKLQNEIDDPTIKNRQRAKLEKRLERFQKGLDNIPDECELVVIPYTKRPSSETKTLREEFTNKEKQDFIRHKAMSRPLEFIKNGFGLKDIWKMIQTGYMPPQKKRQWTVEHIYDLAGGGFNNRKTFCFMSPEDNGGKDDLIVPQTLNMQEGETRLIVSYAPKKKETKNGFEFPLFVN